MHNLSGFFKTFVTASPTPAVSQKNDVSQEKSNDNPASVDKGGNPEDTKMSNPEPEDAELVVHRETVYDLIKDIRDPEKPQTLEELNVVSEENVLVKHFSEEDLLVRIVFVPTVPHCSLASLIGLCLRQKLTECFPEKHKLDIFVKEGTHETADDINKQINDKERIAAAMENPNLKDLVDKCINNDGEYG